MSELVRLLTTLNSLDVTEYEACEDCGYDHDFKDDVDDFVAKWYYS